MISKSLKEVGRELLHDFDTTFVVEEVPDAKRDKFRSEARDWVAAAKAQLDGPMRQAFASFNDESTDTPPGDRFQDIQTVRLW